MFNKKGQNTAEYAILIALVIAAAVAMQTYVKRGLQGRIKDAVVYTGGGQAVGNSTLNFSGNQYEPDYTVSQSQVYTQRNANESLGTRGQITRTNVIEQTGVATGATEQVTYNNSGS